MFFDLVTIMVIKKAKFIIAVKIFPKATLSWIVVAATNSKITSIFIKIVDYKVISSSIKSDPYITKKLKDVNKLRTMK